MLDSLRKAFCCCGNSMLDNSQPEPLQKKSQEDPLSDYFKLAIGDQAEQALFANSTTTTSLPTNVTTIGAPRGPAICPLSLFGAAMMQFENGKAELISDGMLQELLDHYETSMDEEKDPKALEKLENKICALQNLIEKRSTHPLDIARVFLKNNLGDRIDTEMLHSLMHDYELKAKEESTDLTDNRVSRFNQIRDKIIEARKKEMSTLSELMEKRFNQTASTPGEFRDLLTTALKERNNPLEIAKDNFKAGHAEAISDAMLIKLHAYFEKKHQKFHQQAIEEANNPKKEAAQQAEMIGITVNEIKPEVTASIKTIQLGPDDFISSKELATEFKNLKIAAEELIKVRESYWVTNLEESSEKVSKAVVDVTNGSKE